MVQQQAEELPTFWGVIASEPRDNEQNVSGVPVQDLPDKEGMPSCRTVETDPQAFSCCKKFRIKCCRTKSQTCLWCICSTTASFLLAGIVLTCLFWPRNPTWALSGLYPAPGAVKTFIALATGQPITVNSSMAPIIFEARIDVYNPNFLGAYVKPGYFAILSSNMMLGTGTSNELAVAPRSHFSLVTNVAIEPNPWVMQQLSEIMLKQENGAFELPINVFGEADVRVSWVRARAFIMCDIVTQALELLKDPIGDKLIKTQDCHYYYAV